MTLLAHMDEQERAQYWASLALRHTQGLGARSWTRLLRTFGSAYAAIENLSRWPEAGIPAAKAAQVAAGSWRVTARREWDQTFQRDCHVLLWHDAQYPKLLHQLPDAPALLYALGDLSLLTSASVAVVGARQCTAEGVRVAGDISRQLSRCGITIVSGMAQGIDTVAHQAALAGVGRSIAVLGTGIDVIYPKRNEELFYHLVEQGLVLTEFAPGTSPTADNFPIRNRIISGLALGVLVVEATLRSGSLITARLALEQNREVYAIPGPASSSASRGCQQLVRQGARAVFNAEDIVADLDERLREFGIQIKDAGAQEADIVKKSEKKPKNESFIQKGVPDTTVARDESPDDLVETVAEINVQKSILQLLHAQGACHVDGICAALRLPAFKVNAVLTEMQVNGKIERRVGARYVAVSSA